MKYLGKQSIFDDLMIGGVLLTPPDPATYSYELTLPNDDGTAGQVLSTDGSGVLSWVANGVAVPNALTIGVGVDLASGNTSWDGSAAETLNLDLTEVIASDSANRVLTSDGDGTLTAEPTLTFNESLGGLYIGSGAGADSGFLVVTDTGNDSGGPEIRLWNSRDGNAGQDNDVLGTISFHGNNDGTPAQKGYNKIIGSIADASTGSERGKLDFQVMEYDGTLTSGLSLTGMDANGEIDVTIAAGVASTTAIAGELTLGVDLAIAHGGTGQSTAQAAIDALSQVSGASAGHVLTKDGSGNATWAAQTDTTYTAGDGLDLSGTTFSADVKANSGLIIDSTELSMNLGSSNIQGTLAVGDGGTGLTTVGTNYLLTGNGTSPLTAEPSLTYDGSDLLNDFNDTVITSTNVTGFHFDYDKSGIRGASTNSTITGIKSDINDAATNNAAAAITYVGIENSITNASNVGSLLQYGIRNTMSGADLQYGIYNIVTGATVPSVSVGFYQQTDDAAMDIKLVSASSGLDYFGITTGANGATTIKTDENGAGETAHLTFDIDGAIDMNSDGAITLDSGAAINLEPSSGSAILLDGTVSVDGGSVTGITTLGVDSVSLTAVQTSGETFADNDTSIMTSASIDDRINAAVPTVPDEVVSTGTHIHKQTKVTLTLAQCNLLFAGPRTLVSAQGANTIIVPVSVTVLVDNDTGTADSSGADLIVGYNSTTNYQLALRYMRRFMLGITTDMQFNMAPFFAGHGATSLTGGTNVPLTISTSAAITAGSLTSMTIYTSYYVIDNS